MNKIHSGFHTNELVMSTPTDAIGSVGFHVVNLGCKVNRVESDNVAAALLAKGALAVDLADADLIVINTCTVTGEAEKKTRKAVRHALKVNDHARVVVTGCAIAINPDVYAQMSDRVCIVPKGQVTQALSEACEHISVLRVGTDFPTRVGIKIQDGCNNACTYCIVHVARGRAVSQDPALIIDEVKKYERAGVKEMVLTGINLGSYRYKTDEGVMRLADLLKVLLNVTNDVRFRVSSIEPRDVDDDFIELLSQADGRICRHLHLPLQSGSSRVLKQMARPYDAQRFRELIDKLYKAVPSLALSTDIIVGFPGETDEDFEQTCDMARYGRFSKIHIFRYSQREGTPAAARLDQVSPEIKAARAKKLEELERELCQADLLRRKNTTELALVESNGVGTTESYHSVDVGKNARIGSLVECVL